MGLDTFPLLQDQTFLITYNNNVFKLKLEYQEISQEKKEIFVQTVSEQTAHYQIEDVYRAVLYSIERGEKLSPVQTDNFIIYPEVCRWPLHKKVMFIVDGKPLSCYQDLILLKLTCKDVAVFEKDQVVISPSSKLLRCRPSHDMSYVRTESSETNKLITTTLHDNNNSNAYIKMSCVNNSAAINDTPAFGINNSRGGQSPESFNKITAIIQKHCSRTDLPNANDQINLPRLSRHDPTENKMSAYKNVILPNRRFSQRKKFADQKSEKDFEKPQLMNIMNIDTSVKKSSNCGLSQSDCTQDKDNKRNTNLRPSSQRARTAINKIKQKDITVQLEVNRNKASDDNTKLRLSDSSNGQADRSFTESSSISSSQSNSSGERSDGGIIANKEKLKMVTRLDSHKRKDVYSTDIHQGIKKNRRKCSKLLTQRWALRNKADRDMVKSFSTQLKKNSNVMTVKHTHKYESKKVNKASLESEVAIINETSTKNMKYQGHVNEIKQYSNSLDTTGSSVVEISHNGSIKDVSVEKIDNLESVRSDTVAVSGQNRKRKNHCLPKFLECDKETKQKYVSSGLSQEKVTVKSLKHMDSKELIADKNNSNDNATPAKRQMRFSKAQTRASSSHLGSIRSLPSKGQQLKTERNLIRCSSINSSFMSLRSQTNNKRREKGSRLHSNRVTDVDGFTFAAHSSTNTTITRRPHVERFLTDSSKFYHSHRPDKGYTIRNYSKAIKNSKNCKVYNNTRNENLQKNISPQIESEKAQRNIGRTDSGKLCSSTIVTRSLSAKSSHLGTKWSSRTAHSKKGSLSITSEQSGNGTDSSGSKGKLRKVQQQLLKSKDGIWLFLKS